MYNTYDGLNRIISRYNSEEADSTVTYTYTDFGELKSVTDKSGVTEYSYNGLGQKISEASSNGVTQHYEYDGDGNILSYIMQKNSTAEMSQSYSYDSAGRLKSTSTPLGEQRYSYDNGHDTRHTTQGDFDT